LPNGRDFGFTTVLASDCRDRWFQHISIITTDIDKAYAWLRQNKASCRRSMKLLLSGRLLSLTRGCCPRPHNAHHEFSGPDK